jgi:hypothetical protein
MKARILLMDREKKRQASARALKVSGVALALAALLLLAPFVLAQSGAAYDLSWWTVDGGGGSGAGGGYTLMGTAGQPDAGGLSSNGYTLNGGFWVGESREGGGAGRVYLPIVLRDR